MRRQSMCPKRCLCQIIRTNSDLALQHPCRMCIFIILVLFYCLHTYRVRIDNIGLLQPNKSDVLSFLDGEAPIPSRYARATVLYASIDGYFHHDFAVGPLPAKNSTSVVPLTFPFNNRDPGKSKLPSLYGISSPNEWIASLSDEIANITKNIWNSVSTDMNMMR